MKTEKGVTIIEVVAALAVMAVAVVGTMAAVQMCNMSSCLSREHARAFEAAQEMIAQVRAEKFGNIVALYENRMFPVTFYQKQGGRMGVPVGGAPSLEGEVVIVREEDPAGADYGRDLEPLDGAADGVDLGGVFPLDLDANGTIEAGVKAPGELRLIPVFVIVRWRTAGRPVSGRVQLCTFIARKQ